MLRAEGPNAPLRFRPELIRTTMQPCSINLYQADRRTLSEVSDTEDLSKLGNNRVLVCSLGGCRVAPVWFQQYDNVFSCLKPYPVLNSNSHKIGHLPGENPASRKLPGTWYKIATRRAKQSPVFYAFLYRRCQDATIAETVSQHQAQNCGQQNAFLSRGEIMRSGSTQLARYNRKDIDERDSRC